MLDYQDHRKITQHCIINSIFTEKDAKIAIRRQNRQSESLLRGRSRKRTVQLVKISHHFEARFLLQFAFGLRQA